LNLNYTTVEHMPLSMLCAFEQCSVQRGKAFDCLGPSIPSITLVPKETGLPSIQMHPNNVYQMY
jgi:hypothetical protein